MSIRERLAQIACYALVALLWAAIAPPAVIVEAFQ
jgi:hypothetical protein